MLSPLDIKRLANALAKKIIETREKEVIGILQHIEINDGDTPTKGHKWALQSGAVKHVTGTDTSYIIYNPATQKTAYCFGYTAAALPSGWYNADFSSLKLDFLENGWYIVKYFGDANARFGLLYRDLAV